MQQASRGAYGIARLRLLGAQEARGAFHMTRLTFRGVKRTQGHSGRAGDRRRVAQLRHVFM
jgi:hypothetical protein